MNDTSVEMETVYREMMMKKSGQERLKMGFSMFAMTRRQVIASLKKDYPDTESREMKRELFLRFYASDFTGDEKEEILKRI